MKLINTKKITSKSDRLLHSNMLVNNFHFWVHELLIVGQVGKCPRQAIFESYLPKGQAGIQIFFEPCTVYLIKIIHVQGIHYLFNI